MSYAVGWRLVVTEIVTTDELNAVRILVYERVFRLPAKAWGLVVTIALGCHDLVQRSQLMVSSLDLKILLTFTDKEIDFLQITQLSMHSYPDVTIEYILLQEQLTRSLSPQNLVLNLHIARLYYIFKKVYLSHPPASGLHPTACTFAPKKDVEAHVYAIPTSTWSVRICIQQRLVVPAPQELILNSGAPTPSALSNETHPQDEADERTLVLLRQSGRPFQDGKSFVVLQVPQTRKRSYIVAEDPDDEGTLPQSTQVYRSCNSSPAIVSYVLYAKAGKTRLKICNGFYGSPKSPSTLSMGGPTRARCRGARSQRDFLVIRKSATIRASSVAKLALLGWAWPFLPLLSPLLGYVNLRGRSTSWDEVHLPRQSELMSWANGGGSTVAAATAPGTARRVIRTALEGLVSVEAIPLPRNDVSWISQPFYKVTA
ncbi:uncharacterized protein MYCFIDRAFT_179695 [Pseudocercospora fijiensis CIRAD86]|uniref:Uncharacterized protein n=1 Tax=Pseudocercospora fijiensis (strain CIRAD86) TaxID=383855 RepID=M2ZEC7_PSEFD|nr:uncharacterized protein MYCFIDRAFT_179695 [Pseudocercospora fijiensis CIRAD86]EME77484.1 hypothetical protein MYCFIDRAFT_179695 [Pseudocercospora fijiensis CIRAD86]